MKRVQGHLRQSLTGREHHESTAQCPDNVCCELFLHCFLLFSCLPVVCIQLNHMIVFTMIAVTSAPTPQAITY